jgi:YVTN family beta-propeller protein
MLWAQPYAFCVGNFNDFVSVIDMATNTEVTNFRLTQPRDLRARGVAILPNRSKVHITIRGAASDTTGTPGYVRILNVDTTYATLPTLSPTLITVGREPYGACATPDNQYVYVNNGVDGTISVINTATETVDTTFAVGSEPVGIGITPDGTRMVVANRTESTIMVYELPSNVRLATIAALSEPYGVTISKDNAFAYVANRGADVVQVIDLSTNTSVNTITVGDYPTGVAVTPDGNKVISTNANDNSISIIDLSGASPVVSTVSAGIGVSPWGVAIKPDGTQAYIANRGPMNGSMSILDLATNTIVDEITDADLQARAPVGFGDFTGSTFAPASVGSSFPVELLGFEAQPYQQAIRLSWQTVTEQNNDRFIIERSQQPGIWESIGVEAGHGNSREVIQYQFADHQVQPGQAYYYRLKQIDFDGKFSFSPRISATLPFSSQSQLYVDARLQTLHLTQEVGGHAHLLDLNGRTLSQFAVEAGEQTISLAGLPVGLYLLHVESANGVVETHKFLK